MADQPRPEEEKPSPLPAPQKNGWIEGFIQKSTGLPDLNPKPRPQDANTLWNFAGLGLQFAGTAALFAVMGYGLDRETGWTPWGLVTLSMVGVIGGLYLLIKESLKMNKDAPPRAKNR